MVLTDSGFIVSSRAASRHEHEESKPLRGEDVLAVARLFIVPSIIHASKGLCVSALTFSELEERMPCSHARIRMHSEANSAQPPLLSARQLVRSFRRTRRWGRT
jgi:hypothetical protein